MSWLFSRALVAECLQGTHLAGDASELSSATPGLPECWCDVKTKAIYRLSRYGVAISVASRARMPGVGYSSPRLNDFVASSLSVAAFLAPTLARQATGGGFRASTAPSGGSKRGSSRRSDRNAYSWRTLRTYDLEAAYASCAPLPRWGMCHDGVVSELATPGLPKPARDSGWWPTCVAAEGRRGRDSRPRSEYKTLTGAVLQNYPPRSGRLNPRWTEWLMGLPVGWSSLDALETSKFREWQQQHFGF